MFNDLALLLLRLVFGGGMLFGHGMRKIISFYDLSKVFPDPLHITPSISLALASFAEVLCAAFVMVGFFTRISVVPLIINMAVIVLIVHAGNPWNSRELAFCYGAAYVVIGMAGPGHFSIDALLKLFRFPKRRR